VAAFLVHEHEASTLKRLRLHPPCIAFAPLPAEERVLLVLAYLVGSRANRDVGLHLLHVPDRHITNAPAANQRLHMRVDPNAVGVDG
jgi:hypothetical protein